MGHEIPVIYLYIYKKIKEGYGLQIMKVKDVICLMRRIVYQVPKKYDYCILKEMEQYKLLKKVDRYSCHLLDYDCDLKLRQVEDYFLFTE